MEQVYIAGIMSAVLSKRADKFCHSELIASALDIIQLYSGLSVYQCCLYQALHHGSETLHGRLHGSALPAADVMGQPMQKKQ